MFDGVPLKGLCHHGKLVPRAGTLAVAGNGLSLGT